MATSPMKKRVSPNVGWSPAGSFELRIELTYPNEVRTGLIGSRLGLKLFGPETCTKRAKKLGTIVRTFAAVCFTVVRNEYLVSV